MRADEHLLSINYKRELKNIIHLVQYTYVKTTAHVHNYEHEQVPMVTDLHMRPVMGFLCLGTEAGGVYMRTLGQRLNTPILQQGELPSCLGERIYAAARVDLL